MKPTFSHFLILSFSLFLISAFSSCSIEKRRYMDGYHVNWKHRAEIEKETTTTETKTESIAEPERIADEHTTRITQTAIETDTTHASVFDLDQIPKEAEIRIEQPSDMPLLLPKKADKSFSASNETPEDPNLEKKMKRNRALMSAGFIVAGVAFGLAIVFVFISLFAALLSAGDYNPIWEWIIGGFVGISAIALLTALAALFSQIILRNKQRRSTQKTNTEGT